jgi:tetratricopeptide (TPR) repeat protein
MSSGFWSRVRESRLLRVLVIYAGASWAVLEATDFFVNKFGLPEWFFAATLVLLLVGLVNVVFTGWVQMRPAAQTRDVSGPNPWDIDIVDLKQSVSRGQLPTPTWGRAILGGVVAFSLLFGFAGVYVLLTQRSSESPAALVSTEEGVAIAVLPFRVVGPDAELWREGMVDLLYNNLDGVVGLRVASPRSVLSRWRSDFGEDEGASDPAQAAQVARSVGATYAVLGNMIGSASGVRITAEVHDLRDGAVQRAQVEGSPDSVLALVDLLCMEILGTGVLEESQDLPQLQISDITTSSLPALKAYLVGVQNYRRSRFRESIPHFQRAVDEDSLFALALHRISEAYGWVTPFSDLTSEYAQRALALSDRLPEREAQIVRAEVALENFRLEGIEIMEELSARYPEDAEIWQQLGEVYFHNGDQALLPRDRARSAFERAMELDPGFGPAYIHNVDFALIQRDSARAAELIARHREIDPASPHAEGLRLTYALAFGDTSVQAEARRSLAVADADALFTAWARFAWSGSWFTGQSLAVSRAMLAPRHPSAARQFGWWGMVFSNAHLGRYQEARQWIDSATVLGETGLFEIAPWLEVAFHLTGSPDVSRAQRSSEELSSEPDLEYRFWVGAYAADQTRWSEVDDQLRVLDAEADAGTVVGSGPRTGDPGSLAQALRGYTALRRGEVEDAQRDLEASLPGLSVNANGWVRYELGKLALEARDFQTAERYFKSLEVYNQALLEITAQVEYYLGETYEGLGDADEARLHYARFVTWWEEADPELQPWVDRARQALERLTREAA